MFSIIVAADLHNGIGKNNSLPWSLKADMEYFKKVTTETNLPLESNYGQPINAVIMGKNTWFSIPEKYRPLPNRLNVVLSSKYNIINGLNNINYNNVVCLTSLDSALDYLNGLPNIDKVFVIGGAKLYKEAIEHQDCDQIYLTRIYSIFGCDTFFPEIDCNKFSLKNSKDNIENSLIHTFEVYKKHR